jgi:hypothetical protein
MAKLNIVGRSFGSNTIATKEEDGSWKVIVDMVEKRLVKDADWETKTVSAMCTSDTFEKAYATAMESTLMQFQDAIDATGSDSLFELDVDEDTLVEEPVKKGKKAK